MKSRFNLSSIVFGVVFAASIQAMPLQQLFDGGSIVVGDKLFSNWRLVLDAGALSPDFREIDVSGDNGDPRNPGLVYTAFGDVLRVADGAWIDIEFAFDVSVIGGDARIVGSSLEIIEYSLSVGVDPVIGIIDTVESAGGGPLGETLVTADTGAPALFGSLAFVPQSQISVSTFLTINTFESGDEARLTAFGQHFSQMAVPVPGTSFLLAFGLLGIGLRWFTWGNSGDSIRN